MYRKPAVVEIPEITFVSTTRCKDYAIRNNVSVRAICRPLTNTTSLQHARMWKVARVANK